MNATEATNIEVVRRYPDRRKAEDVDLLSEPIHSQRTSSLAAKRRSCTPGRRQGAYAEGVRNAVRALGAAPNGCDEHEFADCDHRSAPAIVSFDLVSLPLRRGPRKVEAALKAACAGWAASTTSSSDDIYFFRSWLFISRHNQLRARLASGEAEPDPLLTKRRSC